MDTKQNQSVDQATNAGKKPLYRKLLPGILPVVLAICLIVSLIVVIPAVKRSKAVDQARSFLLSNQLEQAEQVLSPYISHPDAKAVADEITYARAVCAAESNILDAKAYMDSIPGHSDPHRLRRKIKFAEALATVDTGDYETAYQMMDALGDFGEAAALKEMYYYEALALRSLLRQKENLTDPESLQVKKLTFYRKSNGDLDLLAEITGNDGTGSKVGGYLYDIDLYDGEDDSGLLSNSHYKDPKNSAQTLQRLLIEAIRLQETADISVDQERMNRLLQENAPLKLALPFSKETTESQS